MTKSGENTLGKYNTDLVRDTISSEEYYQHLQTAFRAIHFSQGVRAKAECMYTPLLGTLRETQRALCEVGGAEILYSNCEDLSHYNLGIQSKLDLILCVTSQAGESRIYKQYI